MPTSEPMHRHKQLLTTMGHMSISEVSNFSESSEDACRRILLKPTVQVHDRPGLLCSASQMTKTSAIKVVALPDTAATTMFEHCLKNGINIHKDIIA